MPSPLTDILKRNNIAKEEKMKIKILIFAYLTLIFFTTALMIFALQEQPKPPADAKKVKTWKLPEYMQENLQWMLNDFNKKFDEKVEAYKKELKTRFEEFKDMPEDVVLDLEGGIFIERSDYLKLQEQLRRKMLEEQIKKEVKKNDKTIN